MKDETLLAISAIYSLTALEIAAMVLGQDGQFLTTIIGAVLVLAGVAGSRVALARKVADPPAAPKGGE